MNRHIPEDPRYWSSVVSQFKGTRRKTFCGVTSSHTGTPGLTHRADITEDTPGGLKYVWCPKCAVKWQHEVELYLFPKTGLGNILKHKLRDAIKDWVVWLGSQDDISNWKYRARELDNSYANGHTYDRT